MSREKWEGWRRRSLQKGGMWPERRGMARTWRASQHKQEQTDVAKCGPGPYCISPWLAFTKPHGVASVSFSGFQMKGSFLFRRILAGLGNSYLEPWSGGWVHFQIRELWSLLKRLGTRGTEQNVGIWCTLLFH